MRPENAARRRQAISYRRRRTLRIRARRRPSPEIDDDISLSHSAAPRLAKPKSQVTRNPHAVCGVIPV
jgi:hypothetical protein